MKLGLVVSEFNSDITKIMEEAAREHAKFLDAEINETIYVPGTFDSPIAVQKLLENGTSDAVVVLGAVIQGETKHDEVVAKAASKKILDLSLEYKKPVLLGIIGPGVTRLQAQKRSESYAKRSVEGAVKLSRRLK